MSNPQGNHIGVFTHASTHDPVPSRGVLDIFSSPHSYAPERKCKKGLHSEHDLSLHFPNEIFFFLLSIEDHTQSTYITQRRLCEQLREDAKRERIKVSIVCKDLIRYVTDHQSNDTLVVGFQSPKDNPFREKQQCSLI